MTVAWRLALCAVLACAPAAARAGPQGPVAGEQAGPAPEFVPLREVPRQLELDRAHLREIRARATSGTDLDAEQGGVRELAAYVESERAQDRSVLAAGADRAALADIATAWRQRVEQLRDREHALVRQTSELAADIEALSELRRRWEVT